MDNEFEIAVIPQPLQKAVTTVDLKRDFAGVQTHHWCGVQVHYHYIISVALFISFKSGNITFK